MPRFYKGVGVGTYLHREEGQGSGPRVAGIPPVRPGGSRALVDCISHIVHGTKASPYVSLTKSFAVAHNYAVAFGKAWPTATNPAFVYTVDIPNPLPRSPGYDVIDPVAEIIAADSDPLTSKYHHDGDQKFLLGVVSPIAFAQYRMALTKRAGPWATSRPPNLTEELEAMVRAMRDSEILVIGHVPSGCVTDIQPVF